jgi:UPF0755 protein
VEKIALLSLESNDVIFDKTIFLILGRVFGYQNNIIPGQYSFPNGLSNFEILKLISDPFMVRSVKVTIPEGMTIRQIGRLVQRQLGVDSARFVEEAYNDSLVRILGINAENLEGYLFPDTYEVSFGGGTNEKEIVRTMLTEFRKRMTPEIMEEMKSKNLTLTEMITLASIIEAETRFEAEKKMPGLHNRLKAWLGPTHSAYVCLTDPEAIEISDLSSNRLQYLFI